MKDYTIRYTLKGNEYETVVRTTSEEAAILWAYHVIGATHATVVNVAEIPD